MSRYFYPVKVLLLGLILAQTLAVIQVYSSNTDLYQHLSAMREAGYLVIPNERVMPDLMRWSSAFLGGLFFAMTVGAGLTLFTLAAVWVRVILLFRSRLLLIGYLLFWFISLAVVNSEGFSITVTGYFLIIPPVVFVAANRWLPSRVEKAGWLFSIFQLTLFFVLVWLWIPHMDKHRLIELRDKILLTNFAGRVITDFYYDNTLYAAEAFKSLEQKTLKTSNLSSIEDKILRGRLADTLTRYDYLPVSESRGVDLRMLEEEGRIVLQNRGKRIITTPTANFLAYPEVTLREFSQKSDRYAYLRQFVGRSLVLASPLSFYILLYGLFSLLLWRFLSPKKVSLLASTLCFFVGIGLLAPLYYPEEIEVNEVNVAQALTSESWQDRVAGLKYLSTGGLEIGDLSIAKEMASSPHIPERYWLGRVLGNDRQADSYQILLTLLDDQQLNVACMAFEALGRRGEPQAISVILQQFMITDSWYKQMYAYQALRRLGWTQTHRVIGK